MGRESYLQKGLLFLSYALPHRFSALGQLLRFDSPLTLFLYFSACMGMRSAFVEHLTGCSVHTLPGY